MIKELKKYLAELKKLDLETRDDISEKSLYGSSESHFQKKSFEIIETQKMIVEKTVKRIVKIG